VNPATDMLRQLAEAGVTDTYPCPCHAEGRLVEQHPGMFVITYEHDLDCPKLTGRSAA